MSSYLRRLAVFSARHRAWIIGAWLVALAALLVVSNAAGSKYSSSVTISGSDSAAATDVMSRSFSAELTDASPIVFHADHGTLHRTRQSAASRPRSRRCRRTRHVASVTDPFAAGSTTISARRDDRLRQRSCPSRAAR